MFISDKGQTFENGLDLYGVRFVLDKETDTLFVQECYLAINYKDDPEEVAEYQEDGWQDDEDRKWHPASPECIGFARGLVKTMDHYPLEVAKPDWALPKKFHTYTVITYQLILPDGRVYVVKMGADPNQNCQPEVDLLKVYREKHPSRGSGWVRKNSKEWTEVEAAEAEAREV